VAEEFMRMAKRVVVGSKGHRDDKGWWKYREDNRWQGVKTTEDGKL
jgi:hypothetical protein